MVKHRQTPVLVDGGHGESGKGLLPAGGLSCARKEVAEAALAGPLAARVWSQDRQRKVILPRHPIRVRPIPVAMNAATLLVPLQAVPQKLPLRTRVVHVDAPDERRLRCILQDINAPVYTPYAPETGCNYYAGVEEPNVQQEADIGRAAPPPQSSPHQDAAQEDHRQLGTKHVHSEQVAVDQAALDLRQVAREELVVVGGHRQDQHSDHSLGYQQQGNVDVGSAEGQLHLVILVGIGAKYSFSSEC